MNNEAAYLKIKADYLKTVKSESKTLNLPLSFLKFIYL